MADEQAIRAVISQEFSAEVVHKEEELQRIDDRIQLAKMMLQRLRLGILAQQYGLSGFYLREDYSKENIGAQSTWDCFETDFLKQQATKDETEEEEDEVGEEDEEEVDEVEGAGKKGVKEEGEGREVNSVEDSLEVHEQPEASTPDAWDGIPSALSSGVSSQVPSEAGEEDSDALSEVHPLCRRKQGSSLLNNVTRGSNKLHSKGSDRTNNTPSGVSNSESNLKQVCADESGIQSPLHCTQLPASLGWCCRKKRIIVGNTSQYLEHAARSSADSSSHKWMVYVRGPGEEADISSFVKAVRFFLHPSYHPNDIVRISQPPFHLTRYGWGEFPVRVQLEFSNKRNKHVDIIHNLVLDRTHTGHQTLGAETVVDLDLLMNESLEQLERSGDCLRNNSLHPHRPRHELKQPEQSDVTDIWSRQSTLRRDGTEVGDASLIRHVFVPTSSPGEQVLLDHGYSQIVVVTRGPKPEPKSVEEDMEVSGPDFVERNAGHCQADLDRYLHSLVKINPLCGPESDGFYLAAPSVDHFKKWNIGRRRAAEWMRALALKRHVQIEDSLPASAALTTKQVVDWCRKNGYTPLDPASPTGPGFCKYCGCQLGASWSREETEGDLNCHRHCSELMMAVVEKEEDDEEEEEEDEDEEERREDEEEDKSEHENERQGKASKYQRSPALGQRFSTLSAPFELLELVISKDQELQRLQEQQEREQAVDVTTVPSCQRQTTEPVPRFRVPQTPELKWVQQTAAAIGIPIYPAVIDRMYAHVVEHMIYMACTKFTRCILDRAVSESARQVEGDSSEERTLVPLHVYRAIQSSDFFDFLTNAHFGLPSLSGETDTGDTM